MMKTSQTLMKDYSNFCWDMMNPEIPRGQIPLYLTTKLLNESIELSEKLVASNEAFVDEAGDWLWYGINYSTFHQHDIFNKTSVAYCNNPNILVPMGNILICINNLNQNIVKNFFHKKPLDFFQQENLFLNGWNNFQDLLLLKDITLEKVITFNMNKLTARHGGTNYNKEFYVPQEK